MIKVLQWVYRLGIQHERRRIKLAMTEIVAESTQRLNDWDISPDDKKANMRKRELEFNYAVDRRVISVIDAMLYPKQTEIKETSILEDD